tara:strand:- start:1131 stop:1487 length:357 start_codon:yes stop_codon:yes gene_type:complete
MCDSPCETTYETFIYTKQGIYKKYKKHFYIYETESEHQEVVIDNIRYLIEKSDNGKINKQSILTSIPYKCFYVNRVIQKINLDDNIVMVKEVDNDLYETVFFVVHDLDNIKTIRSYFE